MMVFTQTRVTRIDRWRYRRVASLCRPPILDVGCGLGGLKTHLPPTADYVGCDLHQGQFRCEATRLALPDRSFATVVLCEVLEHLEQPFLALQEATRVARDRVIVTIPNEFSLVRLARLALGRSVEIEPDHIASFNAFNLARIFERLDFRVSKSFCYPLRIQCLPEIPVCSRFGYWLFCVADRTDPT